MEWCKLDGSGNGSMSHDGAGRVTAEFNRTYTYDDFHSLVRAGAASGNNAQGFQYDAVGRLIAVRRGTAGWPVEEELAYDGTQMVAAWNGAGVATWSAVWGQGVDNLISVKPGVDGAEVMALKDGRGSVVGYYQAEATPQGLLATADYTPEGRVTSKDWVTGTTCTETGSTQCPRLGGLPFGFHGAYKSPAHGLLYFRNRWYSAEAGQWLTQDPLGEVDSVNLYAFNRFDSVNFIDRFGLSAGQNLAGEGSIDDCTNTGSNCPAPERKPPRGGPSEGNSDGPVVAPKSPDDVDVRAYMREEAKSDRRNAGRGGIVADAVVQSVLGQNGPGSAKGDRVRKGERTVLLIAKIIDIVSPPSEPHPQDGQNMRSLISNFDEKLKQALKHDILFTPRGTTEEVLTPAAIQPGDQVTTLIWDGKKIPTLPSGTTKLIAVSHGQAYPGELLPMGGSGDQESVTPHQFAEQVKAAGGDSVTTVIILGCDTENGLADGVAAEMPKAHVLGADSNFSMRNTYTSDRPANAPIRPSDGVAVGYKLYDTRKAEGQ